MADISVASWTQLVEAIGECTSEEFDKITITNTIDCAEEIPEGVETTITIPSKTTIVGNYDLHGVMKHRRIKNLRTHTEAPVPIFTFGGTQIHFIGIDFEDMVLDRPLIYKDGRLASSLVQCRFSGQRTDCLFNITGLGSKTFVLKSCYFDVPATAGVTDVAKIPLTSTPLVAPQAIFCRFHENYNGWSLDNPYALSTKWMKMSGCYLDGTYVCSNAASITEYYEYASKVQNAINWNLKTTAEQNTVIDIKAPKGIWNCSIRGYENPVSYLYNNINSGTSLPELGVDMINVPKLAGDGFDIS